MTKKDKELFNESRMKLKKRRKVYKVTFEIDKEIYNNLMSDATKGTKKPKNPPKAPAWFTSFATTVTNDLTMLKADMATVKANQAADHALLVKVIGDVDDINEVLKRNNIK